MPVSRALPALLAVIAAVCSPAGAEPPRVAVIIVIDQFREDYLTRYAHLFGEGGFKRLIRDGARFTDCRYRHALTETGAGHAVLSTGCWGRYNGIIANSWIDPERGTAVYCVSDDDSPELPTGFAKPEPEKPVAKDKASEKAKEPAKFRPDLVFANKDKGKGFSPRNLLTGTLADQLKIAFAGKGKVIAVSLKERAAIVLGGHAPDGAYWWDAATGRFTTAKYYRDALPEWLNAFNKAGLVDSWQGKAWEKLLPDSAYSFLRPDNVPFEKPGGKFGPAFPHVLPLPSPGTTDPAKRITPADYYYCLAMTPYANDLLLDAVQAAVAAERIGQDEFPDLLAVSITANDYVGHAFGPYSHESLDITLRTDRQIEALLAYFDKTFGRNGYVLGLSADHGCMPEPGFAASLKLPTGTDEYKPVVTAAEKALADAFGDDPGRPFIVGVGDHMLYFNRRLLAERRIEPAAAERIAAEAVSRLPQVAAAFSGSQLATVSTAPEQGDDLPQLFARSRHPARSGNVLVALRPWRTWQAKYTANHGSIYGEDQHVPMIFFGAGVKPGRFDGKVGAVDFAPTMAALLDIPPPPSAQGRALRQAIK